MSKASSPQGRNGSIYTRRRVKRRGNRDGGGKQMKRRSVFATVTDMMYGGSPQPGTLPQLRVPVPRTKREKYMLGSPKK